MVFTKVSSVLLYGIPIVSLYIEGQERLCLAQISNTLLKQFSYNEIHNRRVALGITCVQCTPVQLEILRRAGAMPVSSRRCGMITRREAERLCKSFLGDNTPPRLPDDFAFNVQHKCAWGCRGSFLPSRYNSSRAKCIKCSYCGMFFSPNKFIFHSHRITTNDRYIQPDAANFNSWRRHMTLSEHAHEEKIIHAWEDVKAMFNGGTRKRLVGSCNSNNNNRNQNSPGSSSVSSSVSVTTNSVIESACNSPVNGEQADQLPKVGEDSKKTIDNHPHTPYNYSTVAAAAAVVGVTAVAATVGVPFNLHRSSVLSPLQSLHHRNANEHDLSIMPLSRNFVVDYTMWQQQNQQNSTKKSEAMNGFESCPIPWVRPDIGTSATIGNGLRNMVEQQQSFNIKNEPNSVLKTHHRRISDATNNSDLSDFNIPISIPSLLSSSAFKPVVASAAIVSTSLYATRSNDFANSNIYISPTQSSRTTTVFTHNSITAGSSINHRLPTAAIFNSASSAFSPIMESEQHDFTSLDSSNKDNSYPVTVGRNTDYDDDDDDEVVDIETTEDETQKLNDNNNDNAFNIIYAHHSSTTDEIASFSASHSHSGSLNGDVDVDGFTTDAEEQFDLKSNICSYDINISRSNLKLYNNEKDRMSSNAMNTEEEIRASFTKNKEDANGINEHLKRLSRRKCSNQQKERHLIKKSGLSKLETDKIFSTSPSLHIQQRVTFPVFLKSHLNSFRQRHHRQPSPNTIRQFYCCDTVTGRANENSAD